MVLTNTTACFVASPKSHQIYKEIMDKYEVPYSHDSNWLKIVDTKNVKQKEIKEMVENIDGKWQIPILSKAGSFIIWSSTLIHSARLPIREEKNNEFDKWLGWRCIVYVSYRPKEEYSEHDLFMRQEAYLENRTTNHWGTKIFKKDPRLYSSKKKENNIHEKIKEIIKDPKILYKKIIYPNLNDDAETLLGY